VEVPEISEGLIEIVNVAREPGKKIQDCREDKRSGHRSGWRLCWHARVARTKRSPGTAGEKIDIVPHAEDQAKYVCSALSPAKVNRVFMDEGKPGHGGDCS